jgi:alkaline phosphatase D
VQSGDATADSAIVWGRADRPARLWVQASRRPDLRGARVIRGPIVTPTPTSPARCALRNLPSDRRSTTGHAREPRPPGLFGSSVTAR